MRAVILKLKYVIVLISCATFFSCNSEPIEVHEPTIFELLEGKWKLIGAENIDGDIIEPAYNGIINIHISDTTIKDVSSYSEDDNNGFMEYTVADRYGHEPIEYSKSPIHLYPISQNDFEALDREEVDFRDFVLLTNHYYWPHHYIKEITKDRLVFVIAAFPIWPDMVYERVKE